MRACRSLGRIVLGASGCCDVMRVRCLPARTAGVAAIFTEGERSQWQDILALGHLPLFPD